MFLCATKRSRYHLATTASHHNSRSRRKYYTVGKTHKQWGSSSFQSARTAARWWENSCTPALILIACANHKVTLQITDAAQQWPFFSPFSPLSGQCDCTNYKQEDSPKCSGRGTLVCGKCMCHAPYVGSRCETDIETSLSDDSRCRADANSPVCSNNGVCVDGFCECKLRDNPQERYYGQFCECSNFNCERANNRYRCTVDSYPGFHKILFVATIMFSIWQTLQWSRAVWVQSVRLWPGLGGKRLQLLQQTWRLHGQKPASV